VCQGIEEITVDEIKQGRKPIPLIDDGKEHLIKVLMGDVQDDE